MNLGDLTWLVGIDGRAGHRLLLGTVWPSNHGVGRWGCRYGGSTAEATGAAGARLAATVSMMRLVCNLVLTMTPLLVRICHLARPGRPGDDSIASLLDLTAGIFLLTSTRGREILSCWACAGVAEWLSGNSVCRVDGSRRFSSTNLCFFPGPPILERA